MSEKEFRIYLQTKALASFGTFISPSVTHIPDWYKKIPPTFDGNSLKLVKGVVNTTVKACTPFLDAISSGYTFFLASDVYVSWVNDAPQINWKGERTLVTLHGEQQVDKVPVPEGHHRQVFKWHNEHVIETPKGYSLWCTHPVNRFDLPFTVISGFVDTDKYGLCIQFPFFVKEGWTGVIEKGTPLAQLLPIKRDSWKLKECPPMEDEERFNRHEVYRSRIMRAYKHFFWQKRDRKRQCSASSQKRPWRAY